MRKFKVSNSKAGKISSLLAGVLVFVLIFALCSTLAAILALRAESPMDAASVYSLASVVVSAALGGFILCKIKGEGGVKHSLICASLSTALLLILGMIIGGLPGISSLINYVSFIGTASVFAFLGRKRERRHKRRRAR